MNRIFIIPLALLLLPLPAFAQSLTLGNLLDQGARKLTTDEIRALYSGATASGTQTGHPDVTFQNKHSPNGTVTGDAWRNGVWFGKTSGSWSVNNSGQFCYDLQ